MTRNHARPAYDAGVRSLDALNLDEIVPQLYLGAYYAAKDPGVMQLYQIATILTVAAGLPRVAGGFENVVVEVQDSEEQDMLPVLQQCIDTISKSIEGGRGVLVHCWAGASRSVVAVLAYLMQQRQHDAGAGTEEHSGGGCGCKMDLVSAFKLVVDRRSTANPNPSFMRQLQAFYEMGCPHEL